MPFDASLRKVLVIGSGPIQIGQAAEFDYSGSQACRALREEGVKVVLVNSNPATIQTDLGTADEVYLEPLVPDVVKRIIEREKPDGVIATMSGQTGLNIAVALKEFLREAGVRVLGTGVDTIELAENREKFAGFMRSIGQPVPASERCRSVEEGKAVASRIGIPVMVRPDFCLGGLGSKVAATSAELELALAEGISASGTHSVLVEKSVAGLAEIEYEVVRDACGNCVVVCGMENFDPVGVHTGESIVVAPCQTLSDRDHQTLRTAAIDVVGALGVVGACNIQFALDQRTGAYWVIEVNPRASRSSALASKATGYPIARVAAKLALGYRLDEVENKVTGKTALFEPALDYVVVKIPRWPFDKFRFPGGLGTGMKSTGEVMGISRTFEEALHKAVRSLELRSNYHAQASALEGLAPHELRLFQLKGLLEQGSDVAGLAAATGINPWFLEKLANVARVERELRQGLPPTAVGLLRRAKLLGLPDSRISVLSGRSLEVVGALAAKAGVKSAFRMVDTCAGEFEAVTPYYYSTCCEAGDEAAAGRPLRKVVILGSGPIRIGQGIEFDYCTVHAVQALKQAGFETIVINSNPETVSTDFDVSDKLYFEPLDLESVLGVVRAEEELAQRCGGSFEGVLVQFGGQTAMNLAAALDARGVKILGTDAKTIGVCEDRRKFSLEMKRLGVATIPCGTAFSRQEAFDIAEYLGYPVLVRPSFVLGGRAMQVVRSRGELEAVVGEAVAVSEGRPIAIDRFLQDAVEVDVDVLSDGETAVIAGVMEQVDEAGIHSGDSSCVLPCQALGPDVVSEIESAIFKIASGLKFVGLFNVQIAVKGGQVYVLEVNPRASRTVPFVTKATGVPIAAVAARLQCGERLADFSLPPVLQPLAVAVKCPVFPFSRFPGIDPLLGPEMKSTGETMGLAASFSEAFAKAMLAAGVDVTLPVEVSECGKWGKVLRGKFPPAAGRPGILVSTDPAAAGERKAALAEGIVCISSNFAAVHIAECRRQLRLPPGGLPLVALSELGGLAGGAAVESEARVGRASEGRLERASEGRAKGE